MSEIKHTPGPWKLMPREVLEDDSVYSTHIVGGPREIQVCLLESFDAAERAHKNPEMKSAVFDANCRLIAAAPDLLEALQTMVRRIDYYSSLKDDERPNIEQWEYTEGSTDMANARAALAKARGES